MFPIKCTMQNGPISRIMRWYASKEINMLKRFFFIEKIKKHFQTKTRIAFFNSNFVHVPMSFNQKKFFALFVLQYSKNCIYLKLCLLKDQGSRYLKAGNAEIPKIFDIAALFEMFENVMAHHHLSTENFHYLRTTFSSRI